MIKELSLIGCWDEVRSYIYICIFKVTVLWLDQRVYSRPNIWIDSIK